MDDPKPIEVVLTQEERQLMSEITELLKQRRVEEAIVTIKKLIDISKNGTLIKEYARLLDRLANPVSKKPQPPPDQQFEVKVERPTTTFKNIKGMGGLKKALSKEIMLMIVNRRHYLRHKLKPSGLLLYGPPGVGKSMFVEALAGEFNMALIRPDLASLFSQWVGETEKNIVKIVQKAVENQPSIIFIDEVDAKIRAREKIEARGESVVNLNATTQFLETMQNVHNGNNEVIFVGATNRIWDVDSAAKRPGRLGNLIYVRPPSLKDRFTLFRSFLKTVENLRITAFGYLQLAFATSRYSPSDIEEICIDAKKEMLYNNITGRSKDYFNKRFTREEYLAAKAATALPQKPKEKLSTLDMIKVIKRDFKRSSLDVWYVESYKDMVGWEETQVEKLKGKIFSKTVKKKVKHEGKITKDERKIYKDMLKDVKRAHSRWPYTVMTRSFYRTI